MYIGHSFDVRSAVLFILLIMPQVLTMTIFYSGHKYAGKTWCFVTQNIPLIANAQTPCVYYTHKKVQICMTEST